MSKKYYRNQTITKESDLLQEENFWLKEFEKNLKKNAVQSKRVDQNLFDQINSIMNNKSKHSTVSAAVEDMMQRSGLKDYLNNNIKKSEKEKVNVKKANHSDLLNKLSDELKITIKNICESTRGSLPIESIKDELKKFHDKEISSKSLWEDVDFLKYISDVNMQFKAKNKQNISHNLGRMDMHDVDISDDFFSALEPATKN